MTNNHTESQLVLSLPHNHRSSLRQHGHLRGASRRLRFVLDAVRSLTQVQTAVNLYSTSYDKWSNFTLQAWIYLTPVTLPVATDRPIFFKGPFAQSGNNGAPASAELYLFVNGTNYLTFRMGGGSTTYGYDFACGPLTSDVWTHVTVTQNAQTGVANLLVDGSLLASQQWQLNHPSAPYSDESATPRVTGGRIQLGLYSPLLSTAANRFMGRLDEVRVWNRSLGNSEVLSSLSSAAPPPPSSLYSHFQSLPPLQVTSQ